MSFNVNDAMSKGLKTSTATSSGNTEDVTSGDVPIRVVSVTVSASGAAACDVNLYDAATVTGTPKQQVTAAIDTTKHVYWGPDGMEFTTGLSYSVSADADRVTVTYKV